MKLKLTPEQEDAIHRPGHVIVSASAGSGKTFVMIERLVSLILNGKDVRNILAVTFTSKAAAQMKDRLRSALLKGIAERTGEERERLKQQLTALPLAEISTIHSFCGRLARTYFYLLDIDPAFRITASDQAEGKELSDRAMDAAFEEAYREHGAPFFALLSVYYRRRKDAALRELVLKMHAKMRELTDYEARLTALAQTYAPAAEEGECKTLPSDMGVSDLVKELENYIWKYYTDYANMVASSLDERGHACEGYSAKMGEMFALVHAAYSALAQGEDLYDVCARAAALPDLPRMPNHKKEEDEEEEEAYFFLKTAKAGLKTLREQLALYGTREEEAAHMQAASRLSGALAALVLAYDRAFTREKREAGVLDYNDLQHCAIRLLDDERVRADIVSRYEAVFVDEYQDVNPVQEAIVSRIAGKELFLVGDAKQAIYGFRGSRSEFFEEKERSLENALPLSSNFRSAPAVLEAVNRVFAPLVEHYVPMQGSSRYADHPGEVLLHPLPVVKTARAVPDRVYSVLEHAGEEPDDALGAMVARIIEEELGKTWYDADEGKERPVTYGDIAILTRRKEKEAQDIARSLLARGIPITAAAEVNIFDFFEARLLLDWLSYLDNPAQDVPYCTALLSAVGGMTEADLAAIRLSEEGRGDTFRAACEAYRVHHAGTAIAQRLEAFERLAADLRVHARVRTASEVMNELLALGLEAQIAAKPGGAGRLARVRRLVAEGEEVSVNALLARLKSTGYELGFSEGGGEDCVSIVTMHSSKGLEYPVVILAGMDVGFKFDDEKQEVIWTEKYLFAPKAYDVENKLLYSTLLRRASMLLSAAEERKQERNLLYVGMTRAKYRLHLIMRDEESDVLYPAYAKCGADFLPREVRRDLRVTDEERPLTHPVRRALVHRPDEGLRAALNGVYARPYPFEASTRQRVKSSATELLQLQGKTPLFPDDEPFTGKTSAAAGIAYHKFLQHVTFGREAGEELDRMCKEGIFTAEEASLIDRQELATILAMPSLRALGEDVRREQTFLVRLPAGEVTPGAPDDEIIFQGAIDLLIATGEGYHIVDYKYSVLSDRALAEKYAVQIALYRKAVSRITGTPEEKIGATIINIARCREIAM